MVGCSHRYGSVRINIMFERKEKERKFNSYMNCCRVYYPWRNKTDRNYKTSGWSREKSETIQYCNSKYRWDWKVKLIPLAHQIYAEGKEEMCFDKKRLGLSTILWDTILPFGAILCDTIRYDTIIVDAILFDTIMQFSTILFDTIF